MDEKGIKTQDEQGFVESIGEKLLWSTRYRSIASIGHDTKLITSDVDSGWITAPDEVYEKLPMCCKYRDEEVVNNHP